MLRDVISRAPCADSPADGAEAATTAPPAGPHPRQSSRLWSAGAGSRHADCSVRGLKARVALWARANGVAAPPRALDAAFARLQAPGSPFELCEAHVRPSSSSSSSTGAPHLAGPTGQGQRYRYFKNGAQRLHDVFGAHCNGPHRDKTFVVYAGPDAQAGGPERYTFGETYALAGGLAAYLRDDLGLRPGERVSLLMRNYPEWVFAFMATTAQGAVAVPTNSLWVGAEIEYALNDSGAAIVVCDGQRAAQVLPLCRAGTLPHLRAVIVCRDPDGVAAAGGGPAVRVLQFDDVLRACRGRPMPAAAVDAVDPDSNALIMYTSGTTSAPKGVVSTHRNVVQSIRSVFFYAAHGRLLARMAAKAQTRPANHHGAAAGASAVTATSPAAAAPAPQSAILCPVPLFHATGTHVIFLLSFALGRKLVLMRKWNPGAALKLIESERVTRFTGVPTMSMELLAHPDYERYDTSSLQSLGGGGAAPPKKLGAETAKKGKSAGQGWGLTESNALTVGTFSSQEYLRNPSSCGRAYPLIDIKIVDVDNPSREVARVGAPGEILIRGVAMMKEYWNKPEKTREAISVDGWFRTGDIGRLDDTGALYIMDRAKDLIIRGGENISCAEVESALYEHPAVSECAVFAMPDERLGEVVAAALVRKAGAPPFTADEIVAFARERLAKFKVPSVLFLWGAGDQLPRGATGKIPKRKVRDQIQAGTANCRQILPPMGKL